MPAASEIVERLRRRLSDPQSRGALGALSIRLTAVALAFVSMTLLARHLGSAGYGLYAGTLSIASLATYLSKLGVEHQLVRTVSGFRSTEQLTLARGALNFFIGTPLILSILAALGLGLVYLGFSSSFDVYHDTLPIAAVVVPAMTAIAIGNGALRGLMRYILAYIPQAVLMNGTNLVFIVALISSSLLTPKTALLGTAAAWYLAAIVALICVYRAIPKDIRRSEASYQRRSWLKSSFFIALGSSNVLLVGQADILLVGLLSDPAEAGRYAAGQRISSLLLIPVIAVNAGLSPLVAGLFSSGKLAELRRAVTTGARNIFASTVLMTVILTLAGPAFFSFLGKDFENSFTIFAILASGYCAAFLFGQAFEVLVMVGKTRLAGVLSFSGIALNAVADIMLIPHFGALGAALATAILICLQAVVLCVIAQRVIEIRCDIVGAR